MAVYVIGDVQGCYEPLQKLLHEIRFDPAKDQLWFTGDLVNRGPQSLEVLRFVRGLSDRAVCVLGNHDLHLLAIAQGKSRLKPRDTLDEILSAPDRAELLEWLRHLPLLHHDAKLGYTLVHAGLLPQWSLADARRLAREAETVFRGDSVGEFFDHMYGDLPDHWNENLHGFDRLRVIVNAFTRLRFCDTDGNMDLRLKGSPESAPPGFVPWFKAPGRRSHDARVIFGHWSALGQWQGDGVVCLDGGCIWGRLLTAVRLDGPDIVSFFHVDCGPHGAPHAD